LIYDELYRLGNGLSDVGKYDEQGDLLKMGIVNEKDGKLIASLKYQTLYNSFHPGFPFPKKLARIKLNGKVGLVDEKKKIIIPLRYDSIDPLGNLYVIDEKGKYGYMNEYGKIIVPILNEYSTSAEYSSDIDGIEAKESSLLLLCRNNKFGFANKKGKIITSIKYDAIKRNYLGGAFVSINNRSGYVNEKGKEAIPAKFDIPISKMSNYFKEGIFIYKENDKWGAIDSTGVNLIKPKFDSLTDFAWGYSIGSIRDNFYIINKTGKAQRILKYDKITKCTYGLALVSINQKYGLIDQNGKFLSQIIYDAIGEFNYGQPAVVKMDFNKYGFPIGNPLQILDFHRL
jgi:hypothetical protein